MQKELYFLANEEWYTFDEDQFKYVLTDKAPQEAIDSYNEFYRQPEYKDKDGDLIRIYR